MTELYGTQRRRAVRRDNADKLTDRVNQKLEEIWELWEAEYAPDLSLFYREAYLAEQTFTSTHAKKSYRDGLRALTRVKKTQYPLIKIPGLQPIQLRLPPVKTRSWMVNGHLTRQTAKEVVAYWGQQSEYTIEEAYGWLLFSAMVWGGLNNLKALDAFLSFVKNKQKIHLINGLLVCNLEVHDERYGNIYDQETISYARQFIPDVTTQLWLLHLYKRVKVMQPIDLDALACLTLALKNAGQKLTFNQLREGASYVWEQLPGVGSPQIYSRLARGQQQNCSLSATEMALALQEQFEPWEKVAKGFWLDMGLPTDQQRDVPNPIRQEGELHSTGQLKSLLDSPAAKRRRVSPELVQYRDELLAEYSKDHQRRLILWIYQQVTENTSLKTNSIKRYLTGLINGWSKGVADLSMDELETEEWEEVYTQIIQDSGDSIGPILTAINSFHRFQVDNFQAPPISLQGNRSLEHVRARFVSPHLMHRCLKTLHKTRAFDDKEVLMLECMIVLAWRTGLRVGEVTALSMMDLSISGGPSVEELSIDEILIRSNSLGTLKTNNAKRRIPVYALLTATEQQKLNSVLHYRLSLDDNKNRPLFCPTKFGVSFSKSLVAHVFRRLTNSNLPGSMYPFHALRHTALTSIALILSNSELTPLFLDRTEEETLRIRHALLGRHPGSDRIDSQDQFIALAQLAGHGVPDQTFRSYFHFAHLDLGNRLLKAKIQIPSKMPDTIAGISKRRISTAVKTHDRRSQYVCSADLQPLVLKDLMQWVRPWSIHLPEMPELEYFGHGHFQPTIKPIMEVFPGQRGTAVTIEMLHAALGFADAGEDASRIAKRFSISIELVERWLARARYFANFSSSKGLPRLIDPMRVTSDGSVPLQPVKRFSLEEYRMLELFLDWSIKTYLSKPDRLLEFMNVYLKQATGSRTGVRFRNSEKETLLRFLEAGTEALYATNWRLVCRTKKQASEIKAKNARRWKKLEIDENKQGYNGYTLYLRHPNEKQMQQTKGVRNYSSAVLRYVVHILLIAWPRSDVGRKKLLRDPFMIHK